MKKNIGKKVLSLFLAALMLLGAVPFSGSGNLFAPTAKALTEGYYTYKVDGGFATITDVNDSISGDITVPSTLGGYTVTVIGNFAFSYCTSLTSIIIPDSVTSIGNYAFSDCDSLTSINLGNGVTSIGNCAFYYCTSLTGITIPKSVTIIGESVFDSCDILASIDVADENPNYSSADGVLFNKDKTRLIQYPIGNPRTSYTVPGSVTVIGDYAFSYCFSLTSIIIPGNGVTSIGTEAFSSCEALTSITLGNGVASIGGNAFGFCIILASIDVADDNPNYSSADGVLFNKDKSQLIQYPIGNPRTSYTVPVGVTIIGDSAFDNCLSLTNITIPDGVTSIGDFAFSNCENLTGVSIPDSVTSIGEDAFSNCENLTYISIPDGVVSIGAGAFSCTGYFNDDSNWENDVLYIGNHLIKAQYSLGGDYAIKDGTITVADSALYYCTSLTSITIPNSVKKLGEYAFAECSSLADIDVAGDNPNYSSAEGVLFNKDKTLLVQYPAGNARASYTVPNGVTGIGSGAFYVCASLTSIVLPDSVISIGGWAFIGTGYYNDNSNWEDEALYLGNHLINAKNTISGDYTIKNGTKTVADYALAFCNNLLETTIPSSVTKIGGSAFKGCASLERITIPESVTNIGEEVFEGCADNLTIFGVPGSYAETYANANNINFSAIEVTALTPVDGSGCVIDRDAGTIYGLEPGISREEFESNFVSVADGYSLQYSVAVIGTGTVVNVLDENDEGVETYAIVIFGDINASGTINSLDALKALRATAGLAILTQLEKLAGDIDGNGKVTTIDALKILQCATGLTDIDQSGPA
ncbi:MAG: leucine-rich repeat protein [Acutalibacteraceae bacterium]